MTAAASRCRYLFPGLVLVWTGLLCLYKNDWSFVGTLDLVEPKSADGVKSATTRVCLPDNETLIELEQAPSSRYHVFQISWTHVASTMTVNLLTGLFESKDQPRGYLEKRYEYRNYHGSRPADIDTNIVTKTHITDVDLLTSKYGDQFDHLFFIGNERQAEGTLLPPAYCNSSSAKYSNVMCLEYEDIQYSDMDGLRRVVRYVTDRIQTAFPYFACAKLQQDEAVQRLVRMAELNSKGVNDRSKVYGTGGGNSLSHTFESLMGGDTKNNATRNDPGGK